MLSAFRTHWSYYLIEAVLLATFMTSVASVAVLLVHVPEPAHTLLANHQTLRRLLFGLAMGLTAIVLIYSPWGQRSGAHFNPAVTITYFLLGKTKAYDAIFYVAAQFVGGTVGFAIVARLLQPTIGLPSVQYAITQPGELGPLVALEAEVLIAFVLMTVVLHVSNSQRFHRFTGLATGALVATYITFEAPLSGMSMNPARSFASAFSAGQSNALWIYFVGPILGMVTAALLYVLMRGKGAVRCAKLNHPANSDDCVFICGYPAKRSER